MEMQEIPAIQESVKFVGNCGPLFEALAKAQSEFSTIVKDSTATVPGKDGRTGYTFDYAGLDVVLAAVRPALTRNGLAVVQVFAGMGETLTTILAHGEARIEATCGLPTWNKAQELGSVLTYIKRYQLLGLLGVAPSDDDDGNVASGNTGATITPRTRKDPPTVSASGPNTAINPDLKAKIGSLGRAIGLKNTELETFSVDHGCGKLADLNDAKGEVLVKLLETQAAKP